MMTSKSGILSAMFLAAMASLVSGCGTVGAFAKKYDGDTVVRKEVKSSTIDLPVWLSSCVTPAGTVRCQIKSVAVSPMHGVDACTIACQNENLGDKNDKWDERQTGTEKADVSVFTLELKSPANEVVTEEVNRAVYDAIQENSTIHADMPAQYQATRTFGKGPSLAKVVKALIPMNNQRRRTAFVCWKWI